MCVCISARVCVLCKGKGPPVCVCVRVCARVCMYVHAHMHLRSLPPSCMPPSGFLPSFPGMQRAAHLAASYKGREAEELSADSP